MDVKNALNTAGAVMKKEAHNITMASSLIGLGTSVYLVYRVTPVINSELGKLKDPSILDKTKVVFKHGWPAMLSIALTTGSIISSNEITKKALKNNAALIAAYQLSQSSLKDIQDKMVKTIGEKKATEVMDNIARDKVKTAQPVQTQIFTTGYGNQLCMDAVTGTFFYSTVEKIRQAEHEMDVRLHKNSQWNELTFISVNDFYEELNIPTIVAGDKLGWSSENTDRLNIIYSSVLTDEHLSPMIPPNIPCVVINYGVDSIDIDY